MPTSFKDFLHNINSCIKNDIKLTYNILETIFRYYTCYYTFIQQIDFYHDIILLLALLFYLHELSYTCLPNKTSITTYTKFSYFFVLIYFLLKEKH